MEPVRFGGVVNDEGLAFFVKFKKEPKAGVSEFMVGQGLQVELLPLDGTAGCR